jgi:dihydrolipoamide dehydrogenase
MAERFDLIIIGAGPGGYVAAIRAAQLGKKVACIDKRASLGGTCLNIGCIPSKALLDSSELYDVARHKMQRHGIKADSVTLDLAAMLKRKDNVVKTLTDGIGFLFRKNKVTPIQGTGKVLGAGKVEVQTASGEKKTLEADTILLATGSEIASIPSLPFDGKNIVGSTEALNFDKVPKNLIVVGGGYIGLELGSVWSRLGSKVTVLEFLPRILPLTDGEIAGMVHKALVKQGLTFHLETKVTGAKIEGEKITVKAESKEGALSFEGDKVLVCVGRKANIEGLGLKEAGVQFDPKTAKVTVDSRFETSVKGIYAIGDLIHGPMLAHKASEDGVAFAEQLAGQVAHVNYDTIPSVIYIWPEVASVGQTEEQLKEAGRIYRVGKFPFSASGRARAMDETEGIVKVLADTKTDRVLGVHIFGPRASDMIAEAVAIMEFKGSAEDIARIVHAHPTLSESLGEAARMAFAGAAIHV